MKMENLFPFISFVVSALATYLFMPWLLRLCKRRGLYDMPNERKVHHNKIPRLGGVLFLPCTMIGVGLSMMIMQLTHEELPVFTLSTILIMVGVFLIYLIGLIDDILGLPARFKFLIQFIAALFLPICNLYINNLYGLFGLYEIPMWLGYPLTIFICLLIVNSINLIDGIDGLASGLSIIALFVYSLIFFFLEATDYAMFTLGLMGSVMVFFYFNMFGKVEQSTKTFMGDTGSLILGYGLSYVAFKLAMNNDAVLPYRPDALLVSFSLLVVPAFDLVRVALMRLKHGVSIFHADKTHLHHKFLAAGFSMHHTLVWILGIQIFFCIFNLLTSRLGVNLNVIVLLDIVFFTLLQFWLDKQKKTAE